MSDFLLLPKLLLSAFSMKACAARRSRVPRLRRSIPQKGGAGKHCCPPAALWRYRLRYALWRYGPVGRLRYALCVMAGLSLCVMRYRPRYALCTHCRKQQRTLFPILAKIALCVMAKSTSITPRYALWLSQNHA